MRILFLACVVILTSCVVPDRHPYAGLLPVSIDLDMTGNFTLTPEGELHLDLAARCTMGHLAFAGECNREVLDGIRVVAHTPWNQNLPGLWTNAWQLRFQVDWKATGVDPLDDDASRLVARPWFVSGTQWTPSPADASAMLKRIGDATETEIDVVSGGAAPSLEIAAFGIDGNTLHTGESNTLRVRVANSGPGTAYRVVATTRSSIEALHGLRLSFGLIKPGADKVRQLQVEIPASETARDTMLVVSLASANGPSPPNVNRRVLIERTVASPVLALQCVLAGRSAGRFDLDAGQAETFRCTIQNTGKADATQVQIETSVNG
jgi:hypothetical protein